MTKRNAHFLAVGAEARITLPFYYTDDILIVAGTKVRIEQILATGIEVSIKDWQGTKILVSKSVIGPL